MSATFATLACLPWRGLFPQRPEPQATTGELAADHRQLIALVAQVPGRHQPRITVPTTAGTTWSA